MHIAPLSLTVDTLAHNVEETMQQVQHPYADEVEPVGRDQPDHREPDPANLQINLFRFLQTGENEMGIN